MPLALGSTGGAAEGLGTSMSCEVCKKGQYIQLKIIQDFAGVGWAQHQWGCQNRK